MSALRTPLQWWHDLTPWLAKRRTSQKPLVLVVDDHAAPLIAVVQLLNEQGLAARGAGSTRETRDRLCGYNECFGALIVSTSVAREDRGWLVHRCRAVFAELPVIVVAESRHVVFEYQASCFAYLSRPFRPEQLCDLVTLALNRTATDATEDLTQTKKTVTRRNSV